MQDAIGQEHQPAFGNIRIVSLVPSLTELLFDLGLAENLVGRTSFCIHPKQTQSIPRIGGTKHIKLHKIAALRPTHILVNIDENRKEDFAAIREFCPNIIVTHPEHPLDNLILFSLIGFIFGRLQKAQELSRRFQENYDRIISSQHFLKKQHVLYLIWKDPWMCISKQTYIAQNLSLIRWETPSTNGDSRYPELKPIDFHSVKYDLVIFSSEPYPFKTKHRDQFCEKFQYPADKTRWIDGEMVSWYGSRSILGLQYLSNLAIA